MSAFAVLAFLAFAAAINRWRGSGWLHLWGPPWLIPGLALGLGTALAFGWVMGITAWIGFSFWACWGNGDLSMGRSVNPRAPWPWPIERLIAGIKGWPKEAAGLFLRSLFALPFFVAGAVLRGPTALILAPAFAVGVTGAYVLAYRYLWPKKAGIEPETLAELLTGLAFGGAVMGVALG